MDESRLNRRSRPRPFDLRRKVLLKNFLREQMTYIPPSGEMSEISLEITNGDSLMDVSSYPTDTNQNQQIANDEKDANSRTSLSEPGPSSSISPGNENKPELSDYVAVSDSVNDVEINTAKSSLLKISRISGLIRSRSKRKKKGVSKAKLVCKTIKSPEKAKSETVRFPNIFRRKNVIQSKNTVCVDSGKKSASKSFFALFKARKANKKQDKSVTTVQNLNSVERDCELSANTESFSTSTQSVQTDLSWSPNELSNIEHSNRLLREENRLLSDSLSYFMSDARSSFNHNERHETISRSPYDINNTIEGLPFNNCLSSRRFLYSADTARKGLILRSKVLRSKSVQERSQRDAVRICHRTRSMNYHEGKRSPFVPNLPPRPLREPSFQQSGVRTRSSIDHVRNSSSPISRRVPILRTLPINNTSRTVQRRSSMPERTNLENVRSFVYRRSGSVRDYNRPKHSVPFRILPSEAFY